ncbi:hypothetical protein [Streptomyces sp. NPDC001833]|uniref:hypothetical protein n=1 Tax=Streptomyces sp. NPDC001833 TaxID=3154658 RepID=UPI0033256B05
MARHGALGRDSADGSPAGTSPEATIRPLVALPGLGRAQRQPCPPPHPEAAGLGQLVLPGAVCLDVGGGCPTCTAALSALAGPEGRVHRLAAPDRLDEAATVDEFCRQADLARVDFIKAEFGADELGLLLGAFGTLLRDRPTLLLRWRRRCPDPRRTADAVRGLTASLSYTMHGWQEGEWRQVTGVVRGWGGFLFRPCPTPCRLAPERVDYVHV